MSVKVKVCGLTNLADAETALALGADMLGFNFYPSSPRAIAPNQAREILRHLPGNVFAVALFVNATRARVLEVIGSANPHAGREAFHALQFHGEEDAQYCRGWALKIIKAFRLKDRSALLGLHDFPADYHLLDSWSAGYGGSGRAFPWDWLEGFESGKLILSGGLRVENVSEAVQRIRPYGVDVCSGVEARPGIKDHAKLKDFIAAAKGT